METVLSVLVGLTQLRFWAQEGPLRHPGSPHQGWGERSSSAFLHCAPRNFGCWAGGELKGVGGAGGLRHLLRGPQPPGGAGGGLGRDPAPGPAQAWGSVKPHPVLQVYPGRHRGFHLAGPVKPARWAGGGEGAGCTPGFLPTSCLPSRGTRTTAPTSSAGPPAPAPPGRSASGGTPRPHGRPSTAAAQVLGPSVSSAPDEAAPLAFPLTSLSLVCDGSDGCWDVGAPGGDREPVRLPHLEVSLAPCREALCRGSR